MKVVILAGGYGSRFGKVTDFLPKPMIPIGPFPILWHIMRYYSHFGHNEFVLCTGYKSESVKEFFLNLAIYSNDFTIDFANENSVTLHAEGESFCPKVTLAYTGQDTMTGGRLKRVERFLGDDENFMLTYGDGLSNVDLNQLLEFHQTEGKIATLTAVHPPAKFGGLQIDGNRITQFAEKSGEQGALVNGGFYVFQRRIFEFLDDSPSCVLEKEPMNRLADSGELVAYQHTGYWQCMDTTRDLESLQDAWSSGSAPWKVWQGGYND